MPASLRTLYGRRLCRLPPWHQELRFEGAFYKFVLRGAPPLDVWLRVLDQHDVHKATCLGELHMSLDGLRMYDEVEYQEKLTNVRLLSPRIPG